MINARRFSHVTFETPDMERQIAYFTEINGLSLAERHNGRAYLLPPSMATSSSRWRKRSKRVALNSPFRSRATREFSDIRKGVEAEGLSCQARNERRSRHCADAVVRGSEGHSLRIVRGANADQQAETGRRHRADQARASGFCRVRTESFADFYQQGSRLPGVGLDLQDWFVFMRCGPGSLHHQASCAASARRCTTSRLR